MNSILSYNKKNRKNDRKVKQEKYITPMEIYRC